LFTLLSYLDQNFNQMRAKLFQNAVRLLLRIMPQLQVEMTGLEKIETTKRPRLFISNHRSHLDVFLLLGAIPGLRTVAKDELFRLPVLGWMMKLLGHIPFKKGNMEIFQIFVKRMNSALQAGENMLVFPELTRSEPGVHRLKKFKAFPFKLISDLGGSVVPVVVYGTDHAWPKGRNELDVSRPVKVKLLEEIDTSKFRTTRELMDYTQNVIQNSYNELAEN